MASAYKITGQGECQQKNKMKFINNPIIAEEPSRYITVHVRVRDIITSWRESLFSFEWLKPDGRIKEIDELSIIEHSKRLQVENLLKSGKPIPIPILGIGLMDNVEIGSGRAELLTLASQGVEIIPVHIPKSNESDFKKFLAEAFVADVPSLP